MTRRQALRALWAGSIVAALPGCILPGKTRTNTAKAADATDKKADEPVIKYSDDADSDSASKGFFKGNYRRGAWSSEGADVERSLGVGR
ncbi:MAG TPA: hypothetical protein VG406_02075 [Isosphaeraceae bacterium]|jgi:hypothetical protein|nr:hypothetical protein [Isosphaeraceae bacterium]